MNLASIWDRWKWALIHGAVALVLLIDPRHIDNIAGNHPAYEALIVAVWGLIVSWAQKQKGSSLIDVLRQREQLEQKKGNSGR